MSSNQEVWKKHAQQWHQVGTPLRPTLEDGQIMLGMAKKSLLDCPTPQVLVLGVTPEIVQLDWPSKTQLLALDQSSEMVSSAWVEQHSIQSNAVIGCWRAFKIDHLCALNFDQAFIRCRLLHRCG